MKLLLENWRKFLKESKLRVFDFDDTLVKSDSRIKITHQDGTEEFITPAEYAVQEKNPDDTYDYSEFLDVVDPQEITKVTNILRNVINAGTDGREIAILSARDPESEGAIRDWLENIEIDTSNITFALLADANPKAKSDWFENKIANEGVTDILFLDDSGKNVDAVKELQEKYPEVKIRARKVSYAEELEDQDED